MELNATSPDVMTMDTRTPPRIKQKQKTKVMENSHAGVAIPMAEEDVMLEETTKKLNFYKLQKPTTDSGLSTWILLSGQTSTVKPSRKPIVQPTEPHNATIVVEPNKIIKPIFKKRTTTTRKPASTTTTTTTLKPTRLTKIKASLLSNSTKKVPVSTTTKAMTSTTTTTTVKPIETSENSTTVVTEISTNSTSSALPIEAKDGESELPSSETTKKPKRPTTKRKKNKTRRRRPSTALSNSTKTDKPQKKEKPIGTQLYNYLSREVMPSVGVGLVGLMVTAGLASYFLYPFGVARRSYDVDRRDKEGSYYYSDQYSGGIAEEEAIGKVIAGMPSNSLYGNTYKTPTSRHRNRQVDQRIAPNYPITYQKDILEESTTEGQFVVGNVPQEEATPVAVPEHGPRSLRYRKRREVPKADDQENEIGTFETSTFDSTTPISTTTVLSTTTVKSNTTIQSDKINSIVGMFKEFFHLKVHLGLQLLQNATQAVSKYVSHVQRRLDQHYRNYTLNRE